MAKFSYLLILTTLALFVDVGFASHSKENEKENAKGNHDKKEGSHEAIETYVLKTGKMHAELTNLGAILKSFKVPDSNGKLADVVLGYDSLDTYKNNSVYFGSTVGRVANRIGDAKFTLDGTTYKLVPNEGKNILHGGPKGFSRVVWKADHYHKTTENPSITFSYDSKDGEEGFPGELKVKVTYKLHKEGSMSIDMTATPVKKATPVNLAHHTYWNLGGHDSGDILSHDIQILGSRITPVNDELIPTDEIKDIKGTPFDFLESRSIGSKIKELPKGYDINYCLDVEKDKKSEMKTVVILKDPKSGRKMELSTNQPGLQFYTGGMLKDVKGKDNAVYKAHAGLCLETQGYPDAVNHKNFPSQIVEPGETYRHHMLFKFEKHGTFEY